MGLLDSRRKTVWTEFAREVGGVYESGGLLKSSVLKCRHQNWEIEISVHSSDEDTPAKTRITALFSNPTRFSFTIYRNNIFSRIGKFFGSQDILTGDPQFDKDFIVKGNQEKLLAALLADDEIKSLMYKIPRVSFRIEKNAGWSTKKFPKGFELLVMEREKVIMKKTSFLLFFQLFIRVLDGLVEIGVSSEDGPSGYLK